MITIILYILDVIFSLIIKIEAGSSPSLFDDLFEPFCVFGPSSNRARRKTRRRRRSKYDELLTLIYIMKLYKQSITHVKQY